MSQHLALMPRAQHPPRWALTLFALILMVGAVVLLHWLNVRDAGDRVAGTPAQFSKPPEQEAAAPPQPRQEPIVMVAPTLVTELHLILEAPEQARLVGSEVVLESVPVQEVVGDYTFWIGQDADARVPVVLFGELTGRQPEQQVQVRQGERVRLFGVVRKLRDVDAIERAGFLSPGEREALRRSEIFISAWRVVPLGS